MITETERTNLVAASKAIYLEIWVKSDSFPVIVEVMDITIGGYCIGEIRKMSLGEKWEAFTEQGESTLKILNQLIKSMNEGA
jgi:hypothetical protein